MASKHLSEISSRLASWRFSGLHHFLNMTNVTMIERKKDIFDFSKHKFQFILFFSLCPFYLLEQNGSSFETLQTFNISSLTNNLRICLHLKSARRMNMHQYYTNIHHRLLPLQSISTSFFALKTIYHIHQILEIDIFNLFFLFATKTSHYKASSIPL